ATPGRCGRRGRGQEQQQEEAGRQACPEGDSVRCVQHAAHAGTGLSQAVRLSGGARRGPPDQREVGGGTKTRRPIALRMQYNPDCDQPRCYLALEDGKEEPRSLQEIQAYIESENRRLERDPVRSFDSREINIRMEYRFCPNMILIDTPGLIH
ncbi:unnamed protein product, partial [Ectocarpus sp. 13 AM-2016]